MKKFFNILMRWIFCFFAFWHLLMQVTSIQ